MSFIFQAIPERYDLRKRMKVNERAAWIASRYRSQMKKGDIVYFWLGGSPASKGLYGWGVITADAPQPDEEQVYRIEVEYRRSFISETEDRHIPRERIRQHPALQDTLLFRMPVGTNFLLTEEEDAAMREIITQELGNEWLPPKPAMENKP